MDRPLPTSIEQLLGLMDLSEQGLALFDETDTLRYANAAFRQATHCLPDEVITWSDIMRRAHAEKRGVHVETHDIEAWLTSTKSRRGKQVYRAFESDLADGRWLMVTETTDRTGWMLCVLTDITALNTDGLSLRRARDTALRAAMTDELTHLSNRRAVLDRVGQLLARQPPQPMALAMIDLDHFKRINDTWGHDVGDMVLCHFASRLQAVTRRGDIAGRMGGEEFLLVLPDADLRIASAVLDRLFHEVRVGVPDPLHPEVRYTCSAGLVSACPGEDVRTLLRRADTALYQAKSLGRDRYCLGD